MTEEERTEKEAEIMAEQNAFHLVKALDLIDECYHFLRVHPPSKNKMNYSKWESLVEETNYMREFSAEAEHERYNKDTSRYSQEVIDSYEDQLKQRDETIKQKEVAFQLITKQQYDEILELKKALRKILPLVDKIKYMCELDNGYFAEWNVDDLNKIIDKTETLID